MFFRHAGHFLGCPREVVLARLIISDRVPKNLPFSRQKISRAVPKVTARVPILEGPDPK